MGFDLSAPAAADHIAISIAESDCGSLRPLSVDLRIGLLNMQLCARRAQVIEEIFQPDFARAVRGICLSVGPDTQIVNVPDFRIHVHGLGIEGYTLFAQTFEDGLRRFTIRLRRVTGSALALLRLGQADARLAAGRDVLCDLGGRVSVDRLFDEMLAHLYLPLVNLNSYLRAVLDDQRACAGEQFSISAAQLKGRTEILQFAFDRMISELMVARATDDGDGPSVAPAPGTAGGSGIQGSAPDGALAQPHPSRVGGTRQACVG